MTPANKLLIPSRDIPQADLLRDVIACARIVSRGALSHQQIAALLRKTDRQGRYYRRAAEILGLIEKVGKNQSRVTSFGSKLLALDLDTQSAALAKHVYKLAIFRRILAALEKSHGSMDKEDVESLLRSETALATSQMRRRRLKTILAWLTYLKLIKETEARVFLRVRPKDISWFRLEGSLEKSLAGMDSEGDKSKGPTS
jgi:hypothetical protein